MFYNFFMSFEFLTIYNYFLDLIFCTDSKGLNILEESISFVRVDDDLYYNHNFWDLPWPASEKMTSLVILYLEVSYTILFIFLIVSFVLLETIIVYSYDDYLNKVEEGSSLFTAFPIHFTPEEEHFIDMFVILIPTLIVLQIIVPTLGYLYNEEFFYYDTYVSFDVNVIGNQWFWTYEYIIDFCNTEQFTEWNSNYLPKEKEPIFIQFDSVLKTTDTVYRLLEVDNTLILPVNTNILFSFTSRDVIHSWALPQMGIKVDCIPGRVTHTIFSSFFMGVFYGQCSELCGPLHGFMPICVEIISFYNFFVWVLINYKSIALDVEGLALSTDLIYTKEVFSLLGLNDLSKLK